MAWAAGQTSGDAARASAPMGSTESRLFGSCRFHCCRDTRWFPELCSHFQPGDPAKGLPEATHPPPGSSSSDPAFPWGRLPSIPV